MSKSIPPISYLSPAAEADNNENIDIFDRAKSYGVEEFHLKHDAATGLKAVVAIHGPHRGPALGGTRCLTYPTVDHALYDAARLARAMSFKSAFAGLHYSGGKGVLIRPAQIQNADAYFESYGAFIDSLGGRFITAVDVGTSVDDMNIIARRTKHVLSTSVSHGDPSLFTARGLVRGILAAVKNRLNRDDIEGLHIGVQGVGKVGFHLVYLLHQQGAKITISEKNDEVARQCIDNFGATRVGTNKVYGIDCDVLSPCALGGVINDATVHQIKARVICGAANNQLTSDRHGDILHKKKIFYVPDYVVNAGGLIHVALGETKQSQAAITGIYNAVTDIYQRSESTKEPSHRAANRIAEQIISESKPRSVFV